jgi:hypothetical protein
VLAASKKVQSWLSKLTTLDDATAAALADFRAQDLYLDGLTAISPQVAESLARSAAVNLHLDGVTELDAETAQTLAGCKCESLCLRGLARLDVETADALADYAGQVVVKDSCRVDFFRSHALTPETARAYAALSGRMLSDITAFESPDSVAIARAFAAVKGPLALPNLKRISPKTLMALIEKKEVVIPPLETLELIPEPDGSPTEDFIVPEGFQSRKREQQRNQELAGRILRPRPGPRPARSGP